MQLTETQKSDLIAFLNSL